MRADGWARHRAWLPLLVFCAAVLVVAFFASRAVAELAGGESGPSSDALCSQPVKTNTHLGTASLLVRGANDSCWTRSLSTAKLGEEIRVRASITVASSEGPQKVLLRISLPSSLEYLPGTSFVSRSSHGDAWDAAGDGISGLGIYLGPFHPGESVSYEFTTKMTSVDSGCKLLALSVGKNGPLVTNGSAPQATTGLASVGRSC